MRKRSRIGLLIGCLTPWILLGLTSRENPKGWTNNEWAQWRDSQIQRILQPTFTEKSDHYLLRRDVITRASEAFDFLASARTKPPETLGNFAKFVTALHWMSLKDSSGEYTNGLGMDISDRDYWTYVLPWVEFPDLLKSQVFLEAMSTPTTYRIGFELIERFNQTLPEDQKWIVSPFRVQFVKSVDQTTYGRMLVLIPNRKQPDGRILDQWMMFALATPETPKSVTVKSVSVIATLRDPVHPRSHQVFFADFMRERDARQEIVLKPTFLLKPNPSKSCFDCHKSGVIAIHPKTYYRFSDKGPLVESSKPSGFDRVNELAMSYGRPDFGHLDADAFGPSLGTSGRSRTDEFIARATADAPIPAASYDRIRSSMNCSDCHNDFAKLNYLLGVQSDQDFKSLEAKKGLVQSYIENGWMPPDNNLTPAERNALWQCVMKEYLDLPKQEGTFVDWLKGR